MKIPIVSVIVSTYNSERFIRGCIEDLIEQSIFDQLEIIIIDSGSKENEAAVLEPYLKAHANIRLIRTERESLYAAWNRGIKLANGKYITNANADDRHEASFMETMSSVLSATRDVPLVFCDQLETGTENESFAAAKANGAKKIKSQEYSAKALMMNCLIGSMPMWRRELHDQVGFFDETFKIAGDYDMWMRFAEIAPPLKINKVLGTFFKSPNTLSGSDNQALINSETMRVQLTYIAKAPWANVEGLKEIIGKQLYARGYFHIIRNDWASAKPFIQEAVRLNSEVLLLLQSQKTKDYFGV